MGAAGIRHSLRPLTPRERAPPRYRNIQFGTKKAFATAKLPPPPPSALLISVRRRSVPERCPQEDKEEQGRDWPMKPDSVRIGENID